MGTLASQAEIDVWVQAPRAFLQRSGGITPRKTVEIVSAKYCNLVHFGQKIVRSAVVHNAFLNTLTLGTAFLRVSPRNEPCL